jgi:hypothetical protein
MNSDTASSSDRCVLFYEMRLNTKRSRRQDSIGDFKRYEGISFLAEIRGDLAGEMQLAFKLARSRRALPLAFDAYVQIHCVAIYGDDDRLVANFPNDAGELNVRWTHQTQRQKLDHSSVVVCTVQDQIVDLARLCIREFGSRNPEIWRDEASGDLYLLFGQPDLCLCCYDLSPNEPAGEPCRGQCENCREKRLISVQPKFRTASSLLVLERVEHHGKLTDFEAVRPRDQQEAE